MAKIHFTKNDSTAQDEAVRVSFVSIFGNLLLTVFKLFAGLLAHSGAMVSDAIHSASDVVSSLIVIVGIRISERKADKDHPYGHERFESAAAIILSVILVFIGGSIGVHAFQSILDGSYREMAIPGVLAIIASVVSIAAKTLMFFYTRKYSKKTGSPALMAEAWHHLSDALSSVGAFIGIGGAMLGIPVMEPLASIVICLLIIKAAAEIFKDSVNQMLDKSAGAQLEQDIRNCVEDHPDVKGIDLLQTRVFGSRIYVDIEIRLDGSMLLSQAHDIAEQVHDSLEKEFPQIKHVMIHVNPD